MKVSVPETSTRQLLVDLAAPLRDERERVVAQIAARSAELRALREDLVNIDAVLKRLDPDAVPAKTQAKQLAATKHPSGKRIEELVRQASGYVEEHAAEFADGFTYSHLGACLRAAGIGSSTYSMKAAVEQLRDQGVIRAVKKTAGGGMLYAPVNGASRG